MSSVWLIKRSSQSHIYCKPSNIFSLSVIHDYYPRSVVLCTFLHYFLLEMSVLCSLLEVSVGSACASALYQHVYFLLYLSHTSLTDYWCLSGGAAWCLSCVQVPRCPRCQWRPSRAQSGASSSTATWQSWLRSTSTRMPTPVPSCWGRPAWRPTWSWATTPTKSSTSPTTPVQMAVSTVGFIGIIIVIILFDYNTHEPLTIRTCVDIVKYSLWFINIRCIWQEFHYLWFILRPAELITCSQQQGQV